MAFCECENWEHCTCLPFEDPKEPVVSCDCYDGVILGPRYDVDINDFATCPKCNGEGTGVVK